MALHARSHRRLADNAGSSTESRLHPPIRVAIIGYGYASKTFHAPLIASVPGLELRAIGSSDAAKVAADWPGVDVEATPGSIW